jgi:NTE family protein
MEKMATHQHTAHVVTIVRDNLPRSALLLAILVVLAACASLEVGGKRSRDATLSGRTIDELKAEYEGREKDHQHEPVVALVLGGGGMRGYAHIGVLQALEEMGVQPDIVVGTSIGAIVGAAYASGLTPAHLWKKAEETRVLAFADIAISGPAFVKGEALADWTDSMVGNVPIEKFPRRYAAVATDLDRAIPIVLTLGDAGQIARASAAIPGVFLPVRYDKGELVDGGVTSVVPVRVARAMGADVVIAVDIYCHSPLYPASSALFAVVRATQVQSCLISRPEIDNADVLIAPVVSPAGVNDAVGRERARLAGYDAAKAAASRWQAVMASKTWVLDKDAPCAH